MYTFTSDTVYNKPIGRYCEYYLTHISTSGPLYVLPSNNSGAAYGGEPQNVDNLPSMENLLPKPKSVRQCKQL